MWLADLALFRPWQAGLLTAPELARVERFVRAPDRERSVVGSALARLGVAAAMDVSPSEVRIERKCGHCGGPHGKPMVRGEGVFVSVSHSAELVVVAVTRAGLVGVDVESASEALPMEFAREVLSASEPFGPRDDLLTYWCRKESVVKATGVGLSVPLSQVEVSPPGGAPQLRNYLGTRLPAVMADLELPAGYVGALTVLTDHPLRIGIRSAEHLLSSDRARTFRSGPDLPVGP